MDATNYFAQNTKCVITGTKNIRKISSSYAGFEYENKDINLYVKIPSSWEKEIPIELLNDIRSRTSNSSNAFLGYANGKYVLKPYGEP